MRQFTSTCLPQWKTASSSELSTKVRDLFSASTGPLACSVARDSRGIKYGRIDNKYDYPLESVIVEAVNVIVLTCSNLRSGMGGIAPLTLFLASDLPRRSARTEPSGPNCDSVSLCGRSLGKEERPDFSSSGSDRSGEARWTA